MLKFARCCTLLLFLLGLNVVAFAKPALARNTNTNVSTPANKLERTWPATGSYRSAKGFVYVGITGEPPSHPQTEFYDEHSRRWGDLVPAGGTRYQSKYAPYLRFNLGTPAVAVLEDKHELTDAGGRFGYSLWHAKGAHHRPLIVLLQGADDSTRAFGFLTPYFVAHGLDVLTYDQRGTGQSTGNWRYASPQSKADDIIAALRQIQSDPAVDSKRIGVWGPSNGGWIAPIVARHYPVAFMILKSAPSETIADNVLYEIRQVLEEHGRFSPQQISEAMQFERTVFHALATNSDWEQAKTALNAAKTQPWFPFMRIPPGLTVPPPQPMLAALRGALIYDPQSVLEHTTVPTLALFGALDRNVDVADSAAGFRRTFKQAGMRDFTIHVFPQADHLLVESSTGYIDQEPDTLVFARGYPGIMVQWLAKRGFTR